MFVVAGGSWVTESLELDAVEPGAHVDIDSEIG